MEHRKTSGAGPEEEHNKKECMDAKLTRSIISSEAALNAGLFGSTAISKQLTYDRSYHKQSDDLNDPNKVLPGSNSSLLRQSP